MKTCPSCHILHLPSACPERARKIARIEELVRAHEREGLGLLENGTSGITIAEDQRQRMLRSLERDPNWEPPKRWYSDAFGKRYGLEVD